MVVLGDTPLEAREIVRKELSARWNAAPADAKPFVAVRSLWSLVPEEQETEDPHASRPERAPPRKRARVAS